ncbi:MAG TPA: SIS domain-containing protein, partial [Acidimicrobiales bacterium]|nr:SIS domain-containing protein [Acidimicrobiales bacterium]
MCGIVAVLRRPSSRPAPDLAEVLGVLERVREDLSPEDVLFRQVSVLEPATEALAGVDRSLRGPVGLASLLASPAPVKRIEETAGQIGERIAALESGLDHDSARLTPERQEEVNASLIRLKDAWWAVARDRIGMVRSVADLISEAGDEMEPNLEAWWSIQVALAALDRLEVRGRDSAGIHVLVAGHGLDLESPEVHALIGERSADPLFVSGSVRTPEGCLSLVYKAAAEIGELGDNVRALRHALRSDRLLARALESPDARVTVLGHTRWASVGIISQPNAHPLNSEEVGRGGRPYVAAALNGDVDNHVELRGAEGLVFEPEITTDAKVIPAMVSRRLSDGAAMDDAFRATVSLFEGSVAIAASAAACPDQLHLALCGSGQSLYVGLAEDAYVVASEPYGVVEETDRYVRMDGESTQGQIVTLNRSEAGTLAGMARSRYSGEPLPLEPGDVVTASITTRDVDRRGFDHFLLKELTEAPASFRKTLRGRILTGSDGRLTVRVGEDSIPRDLAEALATGQVNRVVVIGQGTAAVAGQAVAAAISYCLPGLSVSATLATELSGFGLSDDMSDTLVVAISQSGTTTDTNRTVDLARTRGAYILAVVNRRNSDLAAKAHGVFHTSDGRDVEMSVASTKAFYSQVAAGWLLAGALAQFGGPEAGGADGVDLDRILSALREMPPALEEVLQTRDDIARIAAAVAPPRRYWAVVGGGPDKIAASEVRIKLSELCYRSISSDATEDKKHIDLSCEPLILLCGSGLRGATADDVAKEVAIYKAHKAVPVVI